MPKAVAVPDKAKIKAPKTKTNHMNK